MSRLTCGDDVMRAHHVRNWYRAPENGLTGTQDDDDDDDRPGLTSTPRADVKAARVAGITLQNWQVTVRDFSCNKAVRQIRTQQVAATAAGRDRFVP